MLSVKTLKCKAPQNEEIYIQRRNAFSANSARCSVRKPDTAEWFSGQRIEPILNFNC